jgi:hypothetical protein
MCEIGQGISPVDYSSKTTLLKQCCQRAQVGQERRF